MRFEGALDHYAYGLRDLDPPPERLRQLLRSVPQEHPKAESLQPTLEGRSSDDTPKRWFSFQWIVGGLGLAGATLVLVLVWTLSIQEHRSRSLFVLKGPPVSLHLEYARYTGNKRYRQKARNHQVLLQGDLIQFVYRQKQGVKGLHLMIVSLNERGTVFCLSPFNGTKSLSLEQRAGTLPWGESLTVRGGAGKERYVAFVAKRSFAFQHVKAMLEAEFKAVGRELSKLKLARLQQRSDSIRPVWTLAIQKRSSPRHKP
ncbi:MAG: hypothetical protein EP343_00040 [Deltaproteobacteria bacterium]|nr:MAG: hypothetical protein EP343_00040 [Deltaproteobacteria bacterium]